MVWSRLSCADMAICDCLQYLATYSCYKTRLCEIAKDMGILSLQLHGSLWMKGRNHEGAECCHVGLRKKELPQALMEDMSDCPSLFSSCLQSCQCLRQFFVHLVSFVTFWHWCFPSFFHIYIFSSLTVWIPHGRTRKGEPRKKVFLWESKPNVFSCILPNIHVMSSSRKS